MTVFHLRFAKIDFAEVTVSERNSALAQRGNQMKDGLPQWSGLSDGPSEGRFPLAVEGYPMRCVESLVPGVTTVTPHARYYSLHAYVATLGNVGGLDTTKILRRCEVVFAAVSILHARHSPDAHRGMSQAHGHDKIVDSMSDGVLRVAKLAAPESYAQAKRGFFGPYLASERSLGLLLADDQNMLPGERSDRRMLHEGFDGLLDLAMLDEIPCSVLEDWPSLCLCGEQAAERSWLRSVMFPASTASERSGSDRRSQTALMLSRLIEMYEPEDISNTLSRKLIADSQTYDDRQLQGLQIVPAWRGVALRRWYTWAWRDLWRWLVNENVIGVVPVSQFQGALAEQLPEQTVAQFRRNLPPGMVEGSLMDAEYDGSVCELGDGPRNLAWLVIGAGRSGRLGEHMGPYFEGGERELRNYELTPLWLQEFLDQRDGRSIRDVGVELCGILLARSQRIALAKSTFKKGQWRVPARVTIRDGYVFRDSNEGGGPVSLRWDQLTQVMCGLGMVKRVRDGHGQGDRWTLGVNGSGA